MDSEIINFNVGGTNFSTYRKTIYKNIKKTDSVDDNDEFYPPHLLIDLVNGLSSSDVKNKFDEKDNKAKTTIFIDRNPKYFEFILDYIRMSSNNEEFTLPNDNHEKIKLLSESKFYKLEGLKELIHFDLFSSLILNTNEMKNKLLKLCEFGKKRLLNLAYRATRDGFGSLDFHSKCDGKANTLTIIQTKDNYIFGGYTEAKWASHGDYTEDKNAFIFSLTNPDNSPIKLACIYTGLAIYCSSEKGPSFGRHDLYLEDRNGSMHCSSRLGHAYIHPSFNNLDEKAFTFLAGPYEIQLKEIEVFQLV